MGCSLPDRSCRPDKQLRDTLNNVWPKRAGQDLTGNSVMGCSLPDRSCRPDKQLRDTLNNVWPKRGLAKTLQVTASWAVRYQTGAAAQINSFVTH
ncbi:hypothetical protein RRG08_050589 [Elysia crispata]|uniref:Uncharacterized protein n=1 Tax=Elysia crispata TaxID=231223 RepID=A0AAE0Z6V9_9GAST|nr:hypothetical protein RRG08_050589 [Elysia crispata]